MDGLAQNNLFETLKGIYSAIESKWYAALDKIDEKIHIYPIIDQIDKVVPSFVVFLALIFLIFILLIGGIGLVLIGPGSIKASI